MEAFAGRTPVDRLVGNAGLDAVTERLPFIDDPLVLYAVTVVVFEVGVLQLLRAFMGYGLSFTNNPLWLLRPPILIGAAVLTGQLHERYDQALAEMTVRDRTDEPELFERLVPPRLAWLFVALGLGFTIPNAIFVIGLPQLYAAGGIFDVLQFLVVVPFGYVPIFAMFLSTYVAIEVVTPRRIAASDLGLYYLDPEGLGGMRPIGELVKLAYYYLLIGLVVFLTALYGPYILGGVFSYSAPTPPGTVANLGFTVVWVAAVMTMVYGLFTLHQFMRRQKREKIQELDELAREHVENPWEVDSYEVSDERREAYEDVRSRIDLVSSTKEYPATFTMWAQLVVGVMIPRAVQFVLSSI